ncbi:MAG: endonuclease/exonuclease/phosphatase family protein [Planctomycetota bacterium]
MRNQRDRLGMVSRVVGLALVAGAAQAQEMWMSDDSDRPPPVLGQYPDLPTIDGDVSDWPEKAYVLGNEEYLAVRFRLHGPVTLNSSPGPIVIRIDCDDTNATGRPHGRLGIDLEIIFSDQTPTADGRRRYGPTVTAFDGAKAVELTPYDIGLEWAPTHASDWFEVRINRKGPFDQFTKQEGIGYNGRAWLALEAAGRAPAEPTFRYMWTLVPPNAAEAGSHDAQIPSKPDNGLRVMSWNVLWGMPQRDPKPFSRILDATGPDIILFQEWDRAEQSEAEIAEWLTANHHRPDVGTWTVERSDAWGVAVATPHPIIGRGPDELLAPGTRWDFPVRYAAAAIDTPLGIVAAASVHYKCCGSAGSEEDTRRVVEAGAVNAELKNFAELVGADFTIIGGDFNMQGTTGVAALTYAGLDVDGSELAQARPVVLGDDVLSTFGRPDRGSVGARLDFIGYPDAAFDVFEAFVIDTARLSPESLESLGLTATDSEASDHRPVIVDLVPASGN